MKKLQYTFIILTLSCCSSIKQLSSQKIAENIGCSTMVLDGKKVLLDMEIDHVNTKFLLDTGSGLSVLIDSTIVKDFQNKEFLIIYGV